MIERALHYSHTLLAQIVQPGDLVVDATMGNGNDTVFLAELVGPNGTVHAFDIQELALENTQKRLEENGFSAQLHLLGHEHVGRFLDHNLKAAVFNLGYLPKGDKKIITLPVNTLRALEVMLEHLLPGGRIVIVVYHGHEGGSREKDAVLNFVQDLPQEMYQVLQYQFINQRNNPPFLLCVERKWP